MPNQRDPGKFGARVWVPRELWETAGEVARGNGSDRSDVIVRFLRWYIGEPRAELPTPAERKEADGG